MQKEKRLFWVLRSKKYLSFRFLPEYEAVESGTKEEMWKQIYYYIDMGYKVG